jgi:hypothetical protein
MRLLLLTLSIAFTAFCVWLAVRIVNRRERWAKRMLAAIVATPVLYVVSFGPACWISSRLDLGASLVTAVYGPVVKKVPIPSVIAILTDQYSRLGARSGWRWTCVIGSEDWKWFNSGE